MAHIDRSGKDSTFVIVRVVPQHFDSARRVGNRSRFSPESFGMGGYARLNNVLIVHVFPFAKS